MSAISETTLVDIMDIIVEVLDEDTLDRLIARFMEYDEQKRAERGSEEE